MSGAAKARTGGGPVLMALLAAALFGASTPASKALLAGAGPLTLAGLLYLGAALAVLPAALRAPWRGRDRRNALRVAGAVVAGGIAGPLLLLLGLRLSSSASVSIWLVLETPATALLGAALFHEHLGGRALLAAALAVGAGALLALPEGGGGGSGALLVAAACACWGLDNNLTALVDAWTPSQVTAIKGAVAGSLNLALGLALEGAPSAGTAASALGVGALAYGVSLVLYVGAAQQLGATRSQVVFSTSPLWGVALAWAALGEAATPLQGAAGALMALSLWLVHRERHEHAHHHEALDHTHLHRHDDGHHDHSHPGRPPWLPHTHRHTHEPVEHSHPHRPDLHHRHPHR